MKHPLKAVHTKRGWSIQQADTGVTVIAGLDRRAIDDAEAAVERAGGKLEIEGESNAIQ